MQKDIDLKKQNKIYKTNNLIIQILLKCMFKVQLEIHHKGCWGSDINIHFPNFEFSSIDCRWIKNKVAHILVARGNQNYFEDIINYLQNRKDVSKVEVLEKNEKILYLRTITKKDKKIGQFSDIFFRLHCFPVAPVYFKGKHEIWTLSSVDKTNFYKIYIILRNKYELKMKIIKKESILTKKQLEILNYAKHFGYYEWPRKKSATEICQMIGIPKTVFLSHLRKAEIKIISEYKSK